MSHVESCGFGGHWVLGLVGSRAYAGFREFGLDSISWPPGVQSRLTSQVAGWFSKVASHGLGTCLESFKAPKSNPRRSIS